MMVDSSMMPEIAPGDIVALKEVQDIAKELLVARDRIYGVQGQEIRLIRHVGFNDALGDPNTMILYPKNIGPEFPKKSLACDKVERMFKILGCVKKM